MASSPDRALHCGYTIVSARVFAGFHEFVQRRSTIDLHGFLITQHVFHQHAPLSPDLPMRDRPRLQNTDKKGTRDAQQFRGLFSGELRRLQRIQPRRARYAAGASASVMASRNLFREDPDRERGIREVQARWARLRKALGG
jgi:hypothetical protein